MSLADINAAAAAQNALTTRINSFFDNADANIADRRNAYDALAADLIGVAKGEMDKTFFINAVGGLDTNTGDTPSTALATIGEAVQRHTPGGVLRLRLHAQQTHTIGSIQIMDYGHIVMSNYNFPVEGTRQADSPVIAGAGYIRCNYVDIEANSINFDGTNSPNGLFRSFGGMRTKLLYTTLTVGNAGIFVQHGSEPNHISLNMVHADVINAGDATVPKLMRSNTWDFTGSSISKPIGKTWGDYLDVIRAADGEARNGLTNLDLNG